MCAYRSAVVFTLACPRRLLTTVMSMPASSSRVAWVMARVVEPDAFYPCPPDQAVELAGDGIGVVGRAVGPAENQALVSVRVAPTPPFELLGFAVLLQYSDDIGVDLDGTAPGL